MTAPLKGIKVVQKASCFAVSVRSVCRLKDGLDPETPSKSRPQLIVGRPSDDEGVEGDWADDPAFDDTVLWVLIGLIDHLHALDSPSRFKMRMC